MNMIRPVSVIPLISNSVMNNSFPNNFSMNLYTINVLSNEVHQFEKYCDAIVFDGLIIPRTIDINNIINIEISIGNTIMYTIPFDLLHNYIKLTPDNYLISIPNDLFNIDSNNKELKKNFIIPLVSLQHHNLLFKLNANSYTFNYQIITKNVYYQAQIRDQLRVSDIEIDIYQYQEFMINNNTTIINPKCISTGIYIKLNSKLIDYELYLDNYLTNKIPNDLIEYYSLLQHKKELFAENSISVEYVYFIPFNMLNTNLDGTINFSQISNVKINILTEDNEYEGKIYIKNINKIKIANGMAQLEF